MPDSAISGLPIAAPLTGAELVGVTQTDASVQTTLTDVAGLLASATTTQNWQSPFRGPLLTRTTQATSIPLPYRVTWQQVEYDTDAFWSAGNPTRFTIPVGITKVRLHAAAALEFNGTPAGSMYVSIERNGSATSVPNGVTHVRGGTVGYGDNSTFTITPVVDVVAGQYFEVRINTNMANINEVQPSVQTWFSIEVVEATDAEARPYDLTQTILGTPATSAIIDQHVMSRTTRLLLNGGPSQFYANTAPSANTDFDVRKNNVSIGTLTFLNGATVGSYTGVQTDFVAGDVMSIVSPANVNGIADLSFNHRLILA